MDSRVVEVNDASVFDYKRVSWGAIFAGVVLALALQMLFGLIGLSFGFGSINPMTEQEPFKGIGTGAMIWAFAVTLISLFLGGWVAARLSTSVSRLRGTIHGATTWALASLASFFLLTTAVGGVLRATGSAAGGLVSLVGKGAGAAVQEGARTAAGELDLSSIKDEAEQLISDSGQATDAKGENVTAMIEKVFAGKPTGVDVDREALAKVLMARTQMSRAEVDSTLNRWEQNIAEAKQKFAEVKANAEQKAREAGQAIADATAKAAAWASALLFIGLLAGCGGGWTGSPTSRSERLFVARHTVPDFSRDISSAA